MSDKGFVPLSSQLGIPGTSYRIQLGLINEKWASRLLKGNNVIDSYVYKDEDIAAGGFPNQNMIVGWVLRTVAIPNINPHQVMKTTQALVKQAEMLRQEFGENIPPEKIMELQAQRPTLIDTEIVKITEQMVLEEAESMQDQNMDPLVLLKQQELALRHQDLELKAQAMGEKQALDEKKLMQTDKLAKEKIESQEDIAQLRANVALDKADKDRNTKKRGDK